MSDNSTIKQLFCKPKFADVQIGVLSDAEDKYKPIGEAKSDTCFLEEDMVAAPQPINCSFSCEIDEKEFKSWFNNARKLFGVFVGLAPKSIRKHKLNYAVYEQRWRKATSIRKAKKYAKIIGKTETYNKRYTFGRLCALYLPCCTVEQSVDKFGNLNTTVIAHQQP